MKRLNHRRVLILRWEASARPGFRGRQPSRAGDDQPGGVLPGVTVTHRGVDATQVFHDGKPTAGSAPGLAPVSTKSDRGPPGLLDARSRGARGRRRNRENTDAVKVANVAETVTVRRVADRDPQGDGHVDPLHGGRVNSIPSGEPWALLRTVPGVMVDRVNIAGNETGQQSNFQSKGTRRPDEEVDVGRRGDHGQGGIGASTTYFNYSTSRDSDIPRGSGPWSQPPDGRRLKHSSSSAARTSGGRRTTDFSPARKSRAINVPDGARRAYPACADGPPRCVPRPSARRPRAPARPQQRDRRLSFEGRRTDVKDRGGSSDRGRKQDVGLVSRSAGSLIADRV